jgi:hypothetical protein
VSSNPGRKTACETGGVPEEDRSNGKMSPCQHRGLAFGLPLGVRDTLRNTDQCQTFLDVPLTLQWHGMTASRG